MRQCLLKRKTKDAVTMMVSWIPEIYAKKGKYLKIKGENGWRVQAVYAREDAEKQHPSNRIHVSTLMLRSTFLPRVVGAGLMHSSSRRAKSG